MVVFLAGGLVNGYETFIYELEFLPRFFLTTEAENDAEGSETETVNLIK